MVTDRLGSPLQAEGVTVSSRKPKPSSSPVYGSAEDRLKLFTALLAFGYKENQLTGRPLDELTSLLSESRNATSTGRTRSVVSAAKASVA